jgi:hypothetical protein
MEEAFSPLDGSELTCAAKTDPIRELSSPQFKSSLGKCIFLLSSLQYFYSVIAAVSWRSIILRPEEVPSG